MVLEVMKTTTDPSMPITQTNGHHTDETVLVKALIIDDDKTNRQLFARVIQSYGYDVLTVTNGKEARRTVETENVNIILLDVMMPDENGFEICRKFKRQPKTSEIPIILMTALFDPQSRSEASLAGANAFFSKPFDMDELRGVMQKLTSNHKTESSVTKYPQT